jgi:DNA polymerase-1
MPGPLLCVDAPSLLYRAFFSLPDKITDGDGHPVNAILGATNAILQVVEQLEPRAVVCCFGAEAAVYRKELYEPYHAHRPPMPDPLCWQWERVPAFWEALGWIVLDDAELEADDVMHSLARDEADAGGMALILSGDRDMFQSVDDSVRVLATQGRGREGGGPALVDADGVRERYGIEPSQVPDFIALRGDPSDGLPGAKGIGEKIARDLLQRHGSLEGAIAAAEDLPSRVGATLRNQADELRDFLDIATLRRIEVPRPEDTPLDAAGGAQAARALGMRRLAERLEAWPLTA